MDDHVCKVARKGEPLWWSKDSSELLKRAIATL